MQCYACGKDLEPDNACPDTRYQFDNALWLAFHGSYGMFVDNIRATMMDNSDEQWICDDDGEYILTEDGNLIDDPDFRPTFDEPRLLPGQPDYEAVICHECAHDLCDTVPWIERLLDPVHSHSHKSKVCDELFEAGHIGWNFGNCHIECMWRHIGHEIDRAQRAAERAAKEVSNG